MKSKTKNNAYKRVNMLLVSRVSMNNFEKNPTNGGTPAIEKIINVIVVMKKLLKLKPWKDWSVLNFVSVELNKVQKRTIKDTL